LSIAALALLTLNVCGGGKGSPSGPTTPQTPAAPTPTPSPTPDPPVSLSCTRLPTGAANPSCGVETPVFMADIDKAINTLQGQRPDIFVGDTVVKVGAYYVGIIELLDKEGICAIFGGEELGVKSSNAFSESYDILTAKNQVRRKYVSSCSPAAIPDPHSETPRPLKPLPGCPLPPSTEVACGREPEGQYYNDVEGAIDQLLKEKPELFDYSDVSVGTRWPRVTDMKAYIRAVQDILVSKGYCATYDGEEMPIKKTNDFSEHYAIKFADKYIRKGTGIYRGSCYPSVF
jgi:hypothetical protein